MKKLILLLLLQSFILTAFAVQTAAELSSTKKQLLTHKATFERKIKQDPKNKGAVKLVESTNKVITGLDALTTNQITADELLPLVESSLKETKRFDTKNAKQLTQELEKLRKSLLKLIDGDEPVSNFSLPSASIGGNEKAPVNANTEPDEETESPVPVRRARRNTVADPGSNTEVSITPVSTSTQPGASGSLIVPFLLFVISGVGIIGVGYYAKNAVEKLGTDVSEELKKIKENLEGILDRSDSKEIYTDVIQNDINKKFDAIQNNTAAFFEQVDNRISSLESKSNTGTEDPNAQLVLAKLQVLEKKISNLEEQATTHAFTDPHPQPHTPIIPPPNSNRAEEPMPVAAQPNPVVPAPTDSAPRPGSRALALTFDKLNLLHNYILGVELKTEQSALKKSCNALSTKLATAIQTRNAQAFEIVRLAKLIQDLFVARHFEDLDEEYQNIANLLISCGFNIEDKDTGATAPPEVTAELVNVFAPNLTAFQNERELIALYEHYAIQAQNNPSQTGSVLGTLKPTISVVIDNKKAILAKGIYVLS